MRSLALCAIVAAAGTTSANAMVSVIDWSVDGSLSPLVNGQQLTDSAGSVFDFGTLFTMTTTGNNNGATVFDSSETGPNNPGPDLDLLAGIGNLVMLQNVNVTAQTTPGIFDVPNDSPSGGEYTLDFDNPTELVSIDLVDLDDGNAIFVTLTDVNGLTRTYDVPNNWTGEPVINGMSDGFGTLLLLDANDQVGPGGTTAIFAEDAGYDASQVASLHIDFDGSGGWGNLRFVGIVPAPGTMALALAGFGIAGVRRRR